MRILANLNVVGTLDLDSVANAGVDTDRFLVQDANGVVRYRTGAEVASDIGSANLAASVLKHQVKLGEAIAKGQAVYVSSSDGTNMIVSKASNTSESTSSKTLGLLETGGALNAQVNVITEGLLAGLDTSTANAGDPVWLGTNGNLIFGLPNKPYAPAHLVFIGIVTRVQQINGEIFIKPQNGFELKEIHDVQITTTPADNTVLSYENSSSLYKMKSIATLLGYTPANAARNITINGTTYDLTADRTWNVGTVTSIGVSVPTGLAVSNTPITGAGTIAISLAAGYSIPTTASQSNWDTAYGWGNHASAGYQVTSQKGQPNGYASLDGGGKVPSTQLPSYVDDVLEYANLAGFPGTGETGKIYVALDNNKIYRWSGTAYIEISPTVGTVWGTITGTLSNQTDLQSALDAKVPTSRTITINGTALDLSANRSWTVGDVRTDGSYANPAWITSLAWSKITGAPAFLTASAGTTGTLAKFGASSTLTDSIIREVSGRLLIGAGTTDDSISVIQTNGQIKAVTLTLDGAVNNNTNLWIKSVTGYLGQILYMNNSNMTFALRDNATYWDVYSYVTGSTGQKLIVYANGTIKLPGYTTNGILKTSASDGTLIVDTTTYLTGNQTITLSGDATGSGTTSIGVTLANSGVTAGTYTKVTVDAKGRVTSGTTLSAGDIPTLNYVAKSGDTMTGQLNVHYTNGRISVGNGTDNIIIGAWDGTNQRLESNTRPIYIVSYGGTVSLGRSGGNTLIADTTSLTWGGAEIATRTWVTSQGYITSYSETDTLATVTNRGNTTTGRINVRGAGNQSGGNILMGNTGNATAKWSYLTGAHYNADTQTQGFSLIGGYSDASGNRVVIGGSIYESNPATEIQFWTHTATTHNLGGTQRGVIDSNGNWGIGINSPSYLFHVSGGSGYVARFDKNAAGADGGVAYFVNGSATGYSSYIYIGSSPGTDWKVGKNILNPASASYTFEIVDSSNNLAMRIAPGGGAVTFPGSVTALRFMGANGGVSSPNGSDLPSSTIFSWYSGNNNHMSGIESGGMWHSSDTQFRWYYKSGASSTERMRLDASNGNLYLNTNSLVATQSWVQSQGYLTSVSDVWVNTSGDTMTGSLVIRNTGSFNNIRVYTEDDNSWIEQTKPDGTIVGRMGFDGYSTSNAYYTEYTVSTRSSSDAGLVRRMSVTDGRVLVLENLNGFTYNGNTVWHAGNLTNLSQLTNGPGYITSYTETDTLATVTGRGASTNTFVSLLGGSRIVVQNSTDGGNNRGIFMWNTSDTNWGIYMSTAGASKSLANGTAPTGIDGSNSHHIRFRIAGSSGNGFIWENHSEQTLMSVRGDNGNLYVRGQIYAGNSTTNQVWHSGNLTNLNQLTNGPGYVTGGPYLALSGGTMTGDLRFNQGSGFGRIAYADNYHGMILRGIPNNAAGDVTVGDYTSLIQHSGDFRFYRTNGSINELYFQVNATAPYWRGNVMLHAGNYGSYALSSDTDSEQQVGLRYLYWNEGVRRMNTDPRWNESGYDADLGCLHIWAWTAAGVAYGRAGIALYNGSAYQYLTTKASTTGMFVNNTQIVTNSGTWSINISGSAAQLGGYSLDGATSIATRIFNNKGQGHSTNQNFNTVMTPGPNYMQQGTNGPTGTASHQWYGFMFGLGSDYGTSTGSAGHYASQLYYARVGQGGDQYLYARDMEGGTWGSWRKLYAGYADSAGALSSMNISQFTNNSGYITSSGSISGSAGSLSGQKYNISDTWFRDLNDDQQVQFYGNSRTMIYRTDGNTNDHGGGGYAHIFYYGGSADGNRRFIINTDGRLWSNYHGWLDDAFASKSTTGVISSEYNTYVSSDGWYTIASYGSGRAVGTFHIWDSDSSRHNYVEAKVNWSFGYGGVTVVNNGRHGVSTIKHIRLLYNTSDQTYGGVKVQVYCENAAWTLRVRREYPNDINGWGAFTQIGPTLENTPSGWAEYARASNVNERGAITTSNSTGYLGGNIIWHAGNDGSGSGLDADTVDGYHASNFLGFNGNSYYQASNWIQFNTSAGLYWPSYNGAHIYANQSNYGSIKIEGSRNGWYGIEFGNGVNLMMNTNEVGFHNNNYGWQMRWADGTIYCHKNSYGGGTSATVLDTSNYSSWAQPKLYQGQSAGDWQNFTNDVGEFRVDEVLNITSGSHSNYPTGVYTYGGVMSWRLNNHSFQLYASHTGDLAYKTQWGNDNYSGWRRILDSSNYPYAANMNQYVRTSDGVTFANVSANDVYTTGGWFRNHTNNNGIYWSNTGWHLYPYDANDFYMRSGSNESSIRFLRSDGTVLGYVHNASDFTMGFLTSSRSWRFHVTNSGAMQAYGPIRRSGHSTGFLEGSYNNVGGNSFYSNPIYTIGSSYNPTDSSLSNMYGIGYSHPNFWGIGKVAGWGLYVCSAGVIDAIIGGDGASTSIWAKTDIVAYSDARVKENVEVVENALEKIQAIRGVTFTRNDVKDTKKRSAGVIAQEVLPIFPEVVTGSEEDMYSVAYGNMAALFIEAIKEQQKQIEELKAQINGSSK